jgi:hypothetical protein
MRGCDLDLQFMNLKISGGGELNNTARQTGEQVFQIFALKQWLFATRRSGCVPMV